MLALSQILKFNWSALDFWFLFICPPEKQQQQQLSLKLFFSLTKAWWLSHQFSATFYFSSKNRPKILGTVTTAGQLLLQMTADLSHRGFCLYSLSQLVFHSSGQPFFITVDSLQVITIQMYHASKQDLLFRFCFPVLTPHSFILKFERLMRAANKEEKEKKKPIMASLQFHSAPQHSWLGIHHGPVCIL